MNFKLLVNYLADECSEGERELVRGWLQSKPENKQFLESLREIWEIEPENIEVDARKAWDRFQDEVMNPKGKKITNISKLNKSYQKKTDNRFIYASALAAAALVFIVFLFISKVSVSLDDSVKEQFAMNEIVTEKGERSKVILTDGTRVILNVDSRLTVTNNFKNTSRKVLLEGEAFFEVAPDSDEPFLIQTNTSIIKVIGTKFNVQAYKDEPEVQVVVAEGKVEFGSEKHWSDKKIYLTRDEMGVLSLDGRIERSGVPNINDHISWQEGRVIFKDTPMSLVERRLERWFDIEVTLQNEISPLSHRLTASFDNEPLEEILDVISLALGVSYEIDGSHVLIGEIKNK